MQTLTKTAPARATVRPKKRPKKSTRYVPASALAGAHISLMRNTQLDIVLEKKLKDPTVLLPFLTGYKQPRTADVLKALKGETGTKVGSVLGGSKGCQVVLSAREAGGEVTLRTKRADVALGDPFEPDLRLTSLVMEGSRFFTDDDAWIVLQIAGGSETPEEMTKRINDQSMHMVNVVEHVPLPVASALSDLLRDHSFRNLMIRQAVPRKR